MSTAVRQRTPEWLLARRAAVTATDIPVLLGLSPYMSEAQLAEQKYGTGPEVDETLRMRVGTALEGLIADEYTRQTGRRVRRCHGLVHSKEVDWAAASPDFRVVGDRRLMEAKWTGSRSRFGDGLPDDVAAQVAWQMFVTDVPAADVAALVGGDELRVYEVERDRALEESLLAVAADFRRRLQRGGPFAHNAASVKAAYPFDSGAEMAADGELDAAVHRLLAAREQRRAIEAEEEALETHIKSRMGDVSVLSGRGFRVLWKRSKDSESVDYRSLAERLMASTPEPERAALVGQFVTVRQGARYFRVTTSKEDSE